MSQAPIQITGSTAQLLSRRLLLTPNLSGYSDQLLLVAVDDTMGSGDTYVRLSVVAPGMELANLEQIKHDLVDRLRGALKPITMGDEDIPIEVPADHDNEWIYKVTTAAHFDTGELQVLVVINDPQYLGYESTRAVLSIVRGILAPVAKKHYRRLVTLEANQRVVPLDFQVEGLRQATTVELPAELKLARLRRSGDKYNEDPLRRNCNALQHTLDVLLGVDGDSHHVAVGLTRGAVRLSVVFDARKGMPNAAQINRIQRTICEVIAMHVEFEGFYNELVFVPARQEDDPEGDYNEDEGFLGEFREY